MTRDFCSSTRNGFSLFPHDDLRPVLLGLARFLLLVIYVVFSAIPPRYEPPPTAPSRCNRFHCGIVSLNVVYVFWPPPFLGLTGIAPLVYDIFSVTLCFPPVVKSVCLRHSLVSLADFSPDGSPPHWPRRFSFPPVTFSPFYSPISEVCSSLLTQPLSLGWAMHFLIYHSPFSS